jgi:deoxyribodipyrimidine photolyase-related protein
MGMMLNLLKKMDPEELFKIKTKANEIIANMDSY